MTLDFIACVDFLDKVSCEVMQILRDLRNYFEGEILISIKHDMISMKHLCSFVS